MVVVLMGICSEEIDKKTVEFPLLVWEFVDIFPNELLGLPPHWEIEFTIKMLSGISPIAFFLYRIALAERTEMRFQLSKLHQSLIIVS